MNLILILLNSLFILTKSRKDLYFKEETSKKYLEFSFDRNLTLSKSMSPEETFKSFFYNQIFIKIKIGSEKIEIPFYLYLQQYSLIIQSSEVSEDQVKGLYDETKSSTFISSNKLETFMMIDMEEAILSQDNFYFNDNEASLLDFYLCKKNYDDTHITEGGKIGFKFQPEAAQSEEAFFITNLKYKEIISELVFSVEYNPDTINDDKGKFYIGDYPHLIDGNKYKEKYLIFFKAANIYAKVEWAFYFDEIKLGDKTIEAKCNAFLYFEIGYIIGTKNYFNNLLNLDIWKKYFNNNKCHETKFIIDDLEKNDIDSKLPDEYTIFYCDKDVDVSKIGIGDLSFIDKTTNYSFIFNSEYLWEEKNGYKYFKILKHEFYNDDWYFGKPFFQKYQLIFDYDNKKIGLYTKTFNEGEKDEDSNKSKNLIVYIVVIIGLVIIIGVLTYVLIKNYKKFTKRKRANELMDDNYNYESNDSNIVN